MHRTGAPKNVSCLITYVLCKFPFGSFHFERSLFLNQVVRFLEGTDWSSIVSVLPEISPQFVGAQRILLTPSVIVGDG